MTDIDTLRQRRELLEAEAEQARIDAAQHAIDTMRAFESYEIVDRFDFEPGYHFGDIGLVPQYLPVTGDRQDGQMAPVFRTEQDLAAIRGMARILTATMEPAIAAGNALESYVVGTGFGYAVTSKKGQQADDAVLAVANRVLDEFLDANDYRGDRETEGYRRAYRDGEALWLLHYQPDGTTVTRFCEPEQLTEQGSETWSDGSLRGQGIDVPFATSWRFGVHRAAHDAELILGYNILWDNLTPSYYPASHVEHWKRNVDRSVARGVSDFYAVRNTLQRWSKLHRNTAIGAAVQAAIAWIEEFAPGTTSASVGTLSAQTAAGSYNRLTPFGGKSTNVEHYPAGSIVRTESGRMYKEAPAGSNSPAFIAVAQAILRAMGLRWSMPEWLISADASNNNFASSLVAEAPWTKFCEREQAWLVQRHQSLLWKVLRHAYEFGPLGGLGLEWEAVQATLDIQIVPPAVAARDKLKEAQTAALQFRNGVLSRTTWQQQAGLDPEIEAANQAEEAEEAVAKAQAMLAQGLPAPGSKLPAPTAAEKEPNGEKEPEEPRPAREAWYP
jgi:hypothetical protein